MTNEIVRSQNGKHQRQFSCFHATQRTTISTVQHFWLLIRGEQLWAWVWSEERPLHSFPVIHNWNLHHKVPFSCNEVHTFFCFRCVVVLYNTRKNKQSHIYNQSRKTITCLAISPDAKYLVTGEVSSFLAICLAIYHHVSPEPCYFPQTVMYWKLLTISTLLIDPNPKRQPESCHQRESLQRPLSFLTFSALSFWPSFVWCKCIMSLPHPTPSLRTAINVENTIAMITGGAAVTTQHANRLNFICATQYANAAWHAKGKKLICGENAFWSPTRKFPVEAAKFTVEIEITKVVLLDFDWPSLIKIFNIVIAWLVCVFLRLISSKGLFVYSVATSPQCGSGIWRRRRRSPSSSLTNSLSAVWWVTSDALAWTICQSSKVYSVLDVVWLGYALLEG